MAVPPTARIGAHEPVMVRVPEGWFWMGCELGRDDEKPEHRVWVDTFDLAVHQVTTEEYACFLATMRAPVPQCWNDSRFNDPKMPVVAMYSWGDTSPELIPDYAERWRHGPEPVELYPSNAYGLCNMGDNVHEWCADWYDANFYACSPERNPRGPSSGTRRASRGGSWRHHIKVSRTAARSSIPPEFKYTDYGFRVARSSST